MLKTLFNVVCGVEYNIKSARDISSTALFLNKPVRKSGTKQLGDEWHSNGILERIGGIVSAAK